MQKNGFHPLVVRKFLNAAAIAFALGSTPTMAKPRDAADRNDPPRRSSETRSARQTAQQRFHLGLSPAPGAQGEAAPESIRVRVLDSRGRCHIDTTVSGPCRLGPLAAGDYTVLYKVRGRFDWRKTRLGGVPEPEILVRGV